MLRFARLRSQSYAWLTPSCFSTNSDTRFKRSMSCEASITKLRSRNIPKPQKI